MLHYTLKIVNLISKCQHRHGTLMTFSFITAEGNCFMKGHKGSPYTASKNLEL